jgi:hypothetical protein
MTKDEMTTLLRSVGTEEKMIDSMGSAFDYGAMWMREEAAALVRDVDLELTAQAIEDIVV